MVQEVAASAAAGLPTLPTWYVLREEDRLIALPTSGVAAPDPAAFPTLDVQRLVDPGDVEEIGKLWSVLQFWGLFKVTGHGMSVALLDGVWDAEVEFFHLPLEEKLRHVNRDDADEFQPKGYDIDHVDTDEQVLDWCDHLYLTVQPEEEQRAQFWPAQPPSLAGLLHEYTLGNDQVTKRVLMAMGRLLGFGEGFFLDHISENGGTYVWFTYYLPCPRPDLMYGLKPHADNSVVTVLLLDPNVSGLQVLLRDGGNGWWVDVPVLTRDELLVVVGEEMEIMSNVVFRAPTHRVVTSGRERMTLVLFYEMEPHKDLQPAEELVAEDCPVMYRKLKAKTFSDGFWDAFALGECTIDFLNIKVDDKELAGSMPEVVTA